jgi:hypothetical protein
MEFSIPFLQKGKIISFNFSKFTICVSHLHCSYGSLIFEKSDPNNFVVEETGCKIKNIGVGILQIGQFCES